MKRRRYGFMDPKVIMGVVVSLIILSVGVFAVFVVVEETDKIVEGDTTTTVTSTETFETDTNATNPDDTWYTYTEVDWEWANVTNLTAKTGSNSFRLNRTNTSGGEDCFSNFTVASNDYEYFETWFKWDNISHNFTRMYCIDEDGNGMGMFDIGGTVASGGTQTVAFYNISGLWQSSVLDNDTWYRLRTDFNWTTNTMRGRLFNGAGTTLNDSGYIPMADGSLTSDNMDLISFSGYTTNPTYIWFDDFALSDSDILAGREYENVGETANTVFNIIGVLLIIGAIMMIVGMVSKYRM